MVIVDKLLASMKEKGSQALIFTQMSRILDIFGDYCLFRKYKDCRIDITITDCPVRTTRSRNRQADLQTMDRPHYIGQIKRGYVFQFIEENSIEEQMLERVAQKDQLVIQQDCSSFRKLPIKKS